MLAAAALLAAPAAHANDVYFDITEGSIGSVRSTTPQPTELRIERGGAIIRSDGPGTENEINVTPRPGDVARLILNGAEKAAATFDGRPTLDDTCSRAGTTTVSGAWQPGDRGGSVFGLLDGPAGSVTGAGSADAGRYTVTFPRAIDRDDTVVISSAEHRSQPDGATLGVNVSRTKSVCPVVVPAKAVITGPAKQGKRRVRRNRRVALPRLEIACPGPGEVCDVDVRMLSPKLGVLAVTRYKIPANGRRAVRARLFKFAMRRLKRRGSANVKVDINVRRPGTGTVRKQARIRLIAPKRKRGR